MRKTYYFVITLFTFLSVISISDNLKGKKSDSFSLQQAGFLPRTETFSKSEVKSFVVTDTLNWKLLGAIKFVKKQNKDYPDGVMYPIINSTLKGKNKKRIAMSGFIVPIDNTTYALSKNVFAACFFCGQAGPETIMGIKFRGGTPKLKTDQYVTLEGNFRINENDVEDWIYHIEDAVIVKGK